MKTLNELIEGYTHHLKQGEIQVAYNGILEFLGKLRATFIKNHPEYDVSSIYQGYMDMSYFSLSTKSLKAQGLKIAIVYLHEKGDFEVWLSARNRDIAKEYASILNRTISDDTNVFHDSNNPDAVIECVLTATPNFEDQSALIETIDQGVEKFVTTIIERL
jgi:predicted glutamine amidotransferase